MTLRRFAWSRFLIVLMVAAFGCASARATTLVGPWVPLFKGVDHSVSTNLRSASLPHLLVIHAIRVDLQDPDVRLFTTPRIEEYREGGRETGGLTVSGFLQTNDLQVAINANLFNPGSYYLPAGTPMDVYGVAVSEGEVVSSASRSYAATLMFDAEKNPTMIPTNWPSASLEGVHTAISGPYPLVVNGENISHDYVNDRDNIHDPNPRTAFGISEDRRYLYMLAVDGRQPGYSESAYDYETAAWLILLGAFNGINMDGGGSTTLVVEDSTGFPRRLNRPSAVADSGRERTVGSHFGVYAAPLPGFINEVRVVAEDTFARVTWVTTEPASSQIRYDTTPGDLGNQTVAEPSLVTAHSVQLDQLAPDTGYYYQIISATESQEYVSPLYFFTTTKYVSTNELFGLEQAWRFQTVPQSSSEWASPAYDDSAWGGPGPGLFWADTRIDGPNPEVNPKTTEVPFDLATGFPYRTYYFRTHFTVTGAMTGASLQVRGYIDDGAVFYLNGAEVSRLRMPEGPVTGDMLAEGYPCEGDATCLDELVLGGAALVTGENTLGVEVHNYNARSNDMTFGVWVDLVKPIPPEAKLEVRASNGLVTVQWAEAGFVLQAAGSLAGPWTDVSSGSATSHTTAASSVQQYFRLRR